MLIFAGVPCVSGRFRFVFFLLQARQKKAKDMAYQAYETVSHARMLAAQGEEDARYIRSNRIHHCVHQPVDVRPSPLTTAHTSVTVHYSVR